MSRLGRLAEEEGLEPPVRPGAQHDRCQAESGRESRYVCFSRNFGGFTLSSRHGGQVV